MIAGLKTLSELPTTGRRIAILGEMRELGEMTEHLHRTVGKALAVDDSDEVILFGESTKFLMEEAIAHGFPSSKIKRIETMEQIRDELDHLESGDLVFIKGSRALYMERALVGWRE
jgi:UDP-N-acetylmuramoyl-tripeptide--D-alanyl-D-alanine ligase